MFWKTEPEMRCRFWMNVPRNSMVLFADCHEGDVLQDAVFRRLTIKTDKIHLSLSYAHWGEKIEVKCRHVINYRIVTIKCRHAHCSCLPGKVRKKKKKFRVNKKIKKWEKLREKWEKIRECKRKFRELERNLRKWEKLRCLRWKKRFYKFTKKGESLRK